MAFPTIINSASTTAATGTTNVTMNMPASIVAGRLLMALVPGAAFTTMSATGWTQTCRYTSGGLAFGVLSKVAVGSDTMSLARPISSTVNGRIYQIDAWSGNLADIATNGPAGVQLSDPPSLTPPGGALDYLWFAALFTSTATAATAAPTNYSNLLTVAANSRALNSANRALNAATEDPGTFTDASSMTNAVAITIAIPPVSAPVTGNFLPFFM